VGLQIDGEEIYRFEGKPQVYYPDWNLDLTLTPENDGQISLHVSYTTGDPEYNACTDRHCKLLLNLNEFWEQIDTAETVWQQYILGNTTRDTLISAGQQLFQEIFGGPDSNVMTLEILRGFLRNASESLRIKIAAEHTLQFPWQLLYVDNDAINSPNPLDGFLGAKHLVVQNIHISVSELRRRQLRKFGVREKIHLSLQRQADVNKLATSLDFLTKPLEEVGYLELIRRDEFPRLLTDLNRGQCREDIMYFCCHGYPGNRNGAADQGPSCLMLSGKALYPQQFAGALGDHALASQPIVFINSCHGGKLGRTFFENFTPVLLSSGASTVIGPTVGIDSEKALQFSEEFMEELLYGENVVKPKQEIIADVFHRVKSRLIHSDGDATPLLFHCMMRTPVHLDRRYRRAAKKAPRPDTAPGMGEA
jgi:hypothetical protein